MASPCYSMYLLCLVTHFGVSPHIDLWRASPWRVQARCSCCSAFPVLQPLRHPCHGHLPMKGRDVNSTGPGVEGIRHARADEANVEVGALNNGKTSD
jgi:hypothetical protein